MDFIKRLLFKLKIERHDHGPVEVNLSGLRMFYSPANALNAVDDHYKNAGGELIPMHIVVIYNTEQLAFEIAKALKNSANDSSKGDDKSNESPKQ